MFGHRVRAALSVLGLPAMGAWALCLLSMGEWVPAPVRAQGWVQGGGPASAAVLTTSPAPTLRLACAAAPAFAAAGAVVTLQAWAVDASGRATTLPPDMRWRSRWGRIDTAAGDPSRALWRLPARGAGGRLSASLDAASGATRPPCDAHVQVATAPSPGPPPIPGPERGVLGARAFLKAGSDEPAGFGAYSYLLIPAPPRDDERERHLRVLATYLRQLPEHEQLERYVPRDGLNLFQLPLRHVPQLPLEPDRMGDAALRAAAERLLASYDHARAVAVLARFNVQGADRGPYLLTRLPGDDPSLPGRVLVEDLSAVDPTLAEEWTRWALRIGAAPRSWSTETLAGVALSLRNMIAHAAHSLPDIGERLPQWVRF